MAVARPGGSSFTAIHVWLVVFVVLWLGSTVWLVIMFTNQQQLIDQAKSAQSDKKAFVTPKESSDPTFQALQSYARSMSTPQPVAAVMLNEIHSLGRRITGDPSASLALADAQIDELLRVIKEAKLVPKPEELDKANGLVSLLGRMHAWFVEQRNARLSAEKQLADAGKRLAAATKTVEELTGKFDSSLADMKKQVEDLQNSKSQFEAAKGAEVEDLAKRIAAAQESMGQLRQDMQKQATNFGSAIRSQQEIIGQQLAKLGDVQGPPPQGAQEDVMAREAIGRILRALPGDTLVHIDLGELDGVTLGMRFSVYSGDRDIPADGRGKALIEAISISPQTSECRVVSPAAEDDPILENDKVQNIILSRNRNRKQRFVVIGGFDIDYDGTIDPSGAAKIRAYIERFGGEVVDAVDAQTDYVVVGRKVGEIAPAKGAAVDATAGPANRDAMKLGQTYEESLARAQALNVPRLRQDVFLNFIGLEPGRNVGKRLLP